MAKHSLGNAIVGIDYTAAHEQSAGIGRLVRDLTTHLAAYDTETRYRLFIGGAQKSKLPAPLGSNFSWHPTRFSPRWLARIWQKARFYMPVETFTGRLDLFHATDFTLPPTLPGCKTIVTVHDLSYVKAPQTAHPAQKAYLDRAVPYSVKRATHVIADSQATKDDLIEVYNTPADKISVVLSGVNPTYRPISDAEQLATVRQRYNIPPDVPYIFSIGTVQPRKNYERAIEALQRMGNAYRDVHYVVAGGKGWLENPIYESIQASGLAERVHFVGFVDDADVSALYSGAILTWYVSLYEGFGFPVLESMACGTPVITSNVSSIPEVAGDAAIMVSPTDVDAIVDAMQRVLDNSDLRDQMRDQGFQQIKRFSWENSAEILHAIYAQVLDLTN